MVKKIPTITVVLNVFKRASVLEKQIDSVCKQTIPPNEIILWKNFSGEQIKLSKKILSKVILMECSENLGVWARFSAALNSKSEFVCILDDDTIPGRKWFENCINSSRHFDGIFGTRGIRFYSKNRYDPHDFYGWQNPVDQITEVDIIGHAWFFKREYLSYFWKELPELNQSTRVGEDIHFSYTVQKYGNLNTYVPPHPLDDFDLWGSLPQYGNKIGTDIHSISNKVNSHALFNAALKNYTNKGFSLYYKKNRNKDTGITIGPGIKSFSFIQHLSRRYPWIKINGKKILKILRKIKIHL